MNLTLKPTTLQDLDLLFLYQKDEVSNQMAAFTAEDPNDKEAYMEKWLKIIENPAINMQTIFMDNINVGSVLCFEMMGETNVSYWIDRQYWGKGIATKALNLFLEKVRKRPLVGRTAFDNYGSQKVLKNCGFTLSGKEADFANARNKKIEEFIFTIEE